jgi:hypothetical protein
MTERRFPPPWTVDYNICRDKCGLNYCLNDRGPNVDGPLQILQRVPMRRATRLYRGLFRQWLVLSALWVGFIGITTLSEVDDRYIPLLVTELVQGGAKSPEVTEAIKTAEERRAAIQYGIELALIPPVLVFVIGSSLLWAFQGFQT